MDNLGSSPLSRGIPVGGTSENRGARIIPALAGNTQPRNQGHGGGRDHPRSRGEYGPTETPRQVAEGSSPLSRGIQAQAQKWAAETRIIPALAGNTCGSRHQGQPTPDHPRSRGEYTRPSIADPRHVGSSPLSRGIQGLSQERIARQRIIPALAGNTPEGGIRSVTPADHPRSRGEYPHDPAMVGGRLGSSPLSRGIRAEALSHSSSTRIIPALAGNTRR